MRETRCSYVVKVIDYGIMYVPCPECGAPRMELCASAEAFNVCRSRWKLAEAEIREIGNVRSMSSSHRLTAASASGSVNAPA
jgi:hypothetical protein